MNIYIYFPVYIKQRDVCVCWWMFSNNMFFDFQFLFAERLITIKICSPEIDTQTCSKVHNVKMIIQRETKDLNAREHILKFIYMFFCVHTCMIFLYDQLFTNPINHHRSITRWDQSYNFLSIYASLKRWVRTELPKNLVPSPRKPNRPKRGGVLPDVFGVDGMETAWRYCPL